MELQNIAKTYEFIRLIPNTHAINAEYENNKTYSDNI